MSGQNVINIVELQNVITSASGLNIAQQTQNDVNNLKKMVNFEKKQILTNIISKYDTSPIVVTDPMAFNDNIYLNPSSLTLSTISIQNLSRINESISTLTSYGIIMNIAQESDSTMIQSDPSINGFTDLEVLQ